jgi:formylglycine-generating enzyme required for sulfatase activity
MIFNHIFGQRICMESNAGKLLRFNSLAPTPSVPSLPPAPISTASGQVFQDKLKDGTPGPEMVKIRGGRFLMGSPVDEKGRYEDERQHEVQVADFAIGKYEVTVGQFKNFVKATKYKTEAEESGGCYFWTGSEWKQDTGKTWRNPGFSQTDDHPVVCVSWNDAMAYVDWLSKQTGKTYRLPTEAEWEYAARAGTQTRWSFGDDEKDLGRYAWYSDNSGDKAHPVGTREPNPWGLYDMHGNAWEWVQDCWHNNYAGAPADGSAWESQNCPARVLRGGAFSGVAWILRSADRNWGGPEIQVRGVGFRCVRGPRRQP